MTALAACRAEWRYRPAGEGLGRLRPWFALFRQLYHQPTRGHDNQPPRRGFRRAQQAEHETVKVAR
jgi:hypothetical protein